MEERGRGAGARARRGEGATKRLGEPLGTVVFSWPQRSDILILRAKSRLAERRDWLGVAAWLTGTLENPNIRASPAVLGLVLSFLLPRPPRPHFNQCMWNSWGEPPCVPSEASRSYRHRKAWWPRHWESVSLIMCPFGEAGLLPFSSDDNKHHAAKSLDRLDGARDEKETAQVIG
jgi:hypothetical protein